MSLYNKVVSLFGKREVRVAVVRRDQCRLRLSEFRADPSMTKMAGGILNHPDFLMMVDVLRTESPINLELFPGTDMTTRALYQARCEGYILALNNLESLSRFEKPTEELTATFESPEET